MNYFSVMLANGPFRWLKTKGEGHTPEGTYPGDPTPLLFAANLAMRSAESGAYDSLSWRPSFPDEVYNPVIWNNAVEAAFVARLLAERPAVFAASGTSPSWPFLRRMVQLVRRHSQAITIVGGPHMDEMWTLTGPHPAHPLLISPEIFEITVSGDGQHPLDFLLRTTAQSLEASGGIINRALIGKMIREQSRLIAELPGRSQISLMSETGELEQFQTSGVPLRLLDHGSPYEHFAPKARFPIFGLEKTAHVMSTFGCTFHCAFCSERGNLLFRRNEAADYALGLIKTARRHGVRKFFFDESVLMAGNWDVIEEFCDKLLALNWELEWGGQLTVHNLTPKGQFSDSAYGKYDGEQIDRVLKKMRRSGFTYLYIGLESGSEQVMGRIDKATRLNGIWQQRVRTAMRRVKACGIRVGTSIMFGNLGETRESMDETIGFVADLVHQGLVDWASPNVATYHPNTPLSFEDGVALTLRYDTLPAEPEGLYEHFEEADPGRVSKRITPEDMRHILARIAAEWGEAYVNRKRVKRFLALIDADLAA